MLSVTRKPSQVVCLMSTWTKSSKQSLVKVNYRLILFIFRNEQIERQVTEISHGIQKDRKRGKLIVKKSVLLPDANGVECSFEEARARKYSLRFSDVR